VNLTTGLTVPVGITLDLTAEGASFELRDGVALTVDGTVNASGHGGQGKGWVAGGLRIGDGTTVINGSGTIRLRIKGRLLNVGSDQSTRQLTLDGVTLVGWEDNNDSLVEVNNGGALVLKSGAITGNTRAGWTDGGGVSVRKGVFRMEGGAIYGYGPNDPDSNKVKQGEAIMPNRGHATAVFDCDRDDEDYRNEYGEYPLIILAKRDSTAWSDESGNMTNNWPNGSG
jgi:hypothetical protein